MNATSPNTHTHTHTHTHAEHAKQSGGYCSSVRGCENTQRGWSFDCRSIPGATHVPLKELTREAALALAEGGVTVVVVGSGDHRSQQVRPGSICTCENKLHQHNQQEKATE
jgi:hypothetical protein